MHSIEFTESFRFTKINYKNNHHCGNMNGAEKNFLVYLIKGKSEITTQDTILKVNEGDLFFIPFGINYKSFWYGNENIEFISLGFNFYPECEQKKFKLQIIDCDYEIKNRILDFPVNKPLNCKILSEFFTIISMLSPIMQRDEIDNDTKICNKALKQIKDFPNKSITEIAQNCNVSESTLYKAFKNSLNKTPNMVKQEFIVQKASSLLTTTDKSIQEISDKLGFSSTSYFRKIIKQYTNKTPKEIRNSSPKT